MSCPFKKGDIVTNDAGSLFRVHSVPGDELYDSRGYLGPELGMTVEHHDGSTTWTYHSSLKHWRPNE